MLTQMCGFGDDQLATMESMGWHPPNVSATPGQ